MTKRTDPYTNFSTRSTPQSEPIPGTVPNSAGGYSFPVDDWTRLRRFLILGSEGGTYYIGETTLTKENAQALQRCIKADGLRVVKEIVEISVAGRNPKQHPVMFALAACTGADDPVVRQMALNALPDVCRTGYAPVPVRQVRRAVPRLGQGPPARSGLVVHRREPT